MTSYDSDDEMMDRVDLGGLGVYSGWFIIFVLKFGDGMLALVYSFWYWHGARMCSGGGILIGTHVI
jgi:hypothetical protein